MLSENFTYNFTDYPNYIESGVITSVLCVLSGVGIIGNCLVLIIIAQNHAVQRANIFIGALAVADLLFLLCCVPFMIYYFQSMVTWDLGEGMCKGVNGIVVTLQTAAVFTLVALSANRYHTIISITPETSGFCSGNIYAQIGVIWALSFSVGVAGVCGSYLKNGSCYFMQWGDPTGDFVFALAYFCFFFVIPIIIIFFYYSRLAYHLFVSIERLPDDGYLARNSQILARRRLVFVVLALVVLFIMCWLPYHTVEILSAIFRLDNSLAINSNIIIVLRKISSPISYLKSALNPIILFAMSSFFRIKLKQLLRCSQKKPLRPGRYISMYSKKVSRTSNGTTRIRLSGIGSPV